MSLDWTVRRLGWSAAALCSLALTIAPQSSIAGTGGSSLAEARSGGPAPEESYLQSTGARPVTPTPAFVSRRDLWLGLEAAGATALVVANDRWFRDRALAGDSPQARNLARDAQPLGDAVVVAPALLLVYGIARLGHRDSLGHAALRTGLSVGVAGGAALLVKEIVGRSRPSEAPADPYRFRPFSGRESFPSGHTVVAFATATALTHESASRWTPWVAFPTATIVAWSRVHDDQHWASDVVAGAALGIFLSARTDGFLRRRGFPPLRLSGGPRAAGWQVAIELVHPPRSSASDPGGS